MPLSMDVQRINLRGSKTSKVWLSHKRTDKFNYQSFPRYSTPPFSIVDITV